jgi:hypothetical protein
MEIFTSSTCPPCYTLATTGYGGSGMANYLPTQNTNNMYSAQLACISHQVNWPGSGDHAYNADVGTRVSYYGITGAPSVLVDNGASSSPSDVTAAAAVPAYLDIEATHSNSGGVVTVDVTVDPYATFSNAKLHIAILDADYDAGTSANNFTNGETAFHHVLRKMIPSANGTTVNLSNGTQYTTSEDYSYTLSSVPFPSQGSFDLHAQSEQEIVVFVQASDGEILNAAISVGETLEQDELASEIGLSVYPNPAYDMANIQFELNESAVVTVELVNTVGQVVYTNNLGEVNGTQKVQLNTADVAAGMYLVNIKVDGKVNTKRISIVK